MTRETMKWRTPLVLVMLLPLLILQASPARADPWHFSDVDRIVAIGDVHGAFGALTKTLQAANVIDGKHAWRAGKTHLVFTGDLLDRGADSRKVMDLIWRLEGEARQAGGRVHLVLGNHEVMNLTGDLRYVAKEEYAAFADMESASERKRWYRHFRNAWPADADEKTMRAEFEKAAPPGYFGHRRAFRHNGRYGKWLLTKPLIVVINDTAFVHGGLPPYVTEYGLEGVNTGLMDDLREYVETRDALHDAKVLSPIHRFRQAARVLLEMDQNGALANTYKPAAQRILELTESPLHGPEGPTWYRGTASCSNLVEGDALDAAFSAIDARRAVMGHTSTITRKIQQRAGGRTVEIDTGMLNSVYRGSGNALIIEGDRLSVVNQDGDNRGDPIEHPLRVGHEGMNIGDAGLAEILRTGDITELAADGASWKLVHVATADLWVFAYFRALPESSQSAPELAAYKLDRLLRLGMVPVTVRREIDGRPGILQFLPDDAITERERVAGGLGGDASCAVEKQRGAMHIFDALINNNTRTPSTMLYSPEDWLLMLVENERSFGSDTDRPTYLDEMDLSVGGQWRAALGKIDDDTLRVELSDVLTDQELKALATRRDALINE